MISDRAIWYAFVCVMFGIGTYNLGEPISRLATAAEGHLEYLLEDRKCDVIHGTIPERPKGSGWKLEWVQQRKGKR